MVDVTTIAPGSNWGGIWEMSAVETPKEVTWFWPIPIMLFVVLRLGIKVPDPLKAPEGFFKFKVPSKLPEEELFWLKVTRGKVIDEEFV